MPEARGPEARNRELGSRGREARGQEPGARGRKLEARGLEPGARARVGVRRKGAARNRDRVPGKPEI